MGKILGNVLLFACMSSGIMKPAAQSSSAIMATAAKSGSATAAAIAAYTARPPQTERKLATALDYSDDPEVYTPNPELLPESAQTIFAPGCRAVQARAALGLGAIKRVLPLPDRCLCLVLEYALSGENPCINALKWISPRIAVKGLQTAPLKTHSGIRITRENVWLSDTTFACLEQEFKYSYNSGIGRARSLSIRTINSTEPSAYHELDTDWISNFCCSPDGSLIVTLNDNELNLWDQKLHRCFTRSLIDSVHRICWSYKPGEKSSKIPMLCIASYDITDPDKGKIIISIFLIQKTDSCVELIPYYEYTKFIVSHIEDCASICFCLKSASDAQSLILLRGWNWIDVIHIPTNTIETYTISHSEQAGVSSSGDYLITPVSKQKSLFTPGVNRETLKMIPLFKNSSYNQQIDSQHMEALNIHKLSNLSCSSGLITVSCLRKLANGTFKSSTLFIDEKSGKIIKELAMSAAMRLSPDGSKLLMTDDNQNISLLTAPFQPGALYQSIHKHYNFLATMNYYANLAKIYHSTRLIRKIKSVSPLLAQQIFKGFTALHARYTIAKGIARAVSIH